MRVPTMTNVKREPISPDEPHEMTVVGLGMCSTCGCHFDAHRINGVTYDEFKAAVQRMCDLGGLGRRVRAVDGILYPWTIGAGVGETARQILERAGVPNLS
jgi:hypothetical protein